MNFIATVLYFSIYLFCSAKAADGTFNAQAYQSIGEVLTFPETSYPEIQAKHNVGVTFSGGGSRSYTATIGTMSAFHQLGYVQYVKYIASSSGGSWGTSVYSYFQHDNITDDVMLGPIVMPANITDDGLHEMDPNCVRGYTNGSYIPDADGIEYIDWVIAVQAIYFDPAGIYRHVPFSYDNETVQGIIARNPQLNNTDFIVLRGKNQNNNTQGEVSLDTVDERPFPIIQATMVGPLSGMPWKPNNRNYSLMEWTPLSAGVAYSHDVSYTPESKGPEDPVTTVNMIGGYIEPFAFNNTGAPTVGLPPNVTQGFLEVPESGIWCDLVLASGTSSWAPGEYIASSSSSDIEKLAGQFQYWAPAAPNPLDQLTTMAAGDGGGNSNTDLVSLLQRNVSSIIAFVNTNTPLQNSTNWNPATDNLTTQIDFTVPAWFGQIAQNLSEISIDSFDLVNSQVFEPDEWLPFVTALQTALEVGNGCVVQQTHTTVANPKFGIQAGQKVKVLWIYLARATNWEAQLSPEMQELVLPDDPSNQANSIDHGPYKDFPWYMTALDDIAYHRANLLADLCGWVVLQNQHLFRAALGMEANVIDAPTSQPTSMPTETQSGTSSSNDDDTFVTSDEGILTISLVAFVAIVAICVTVYCTYMKANSKNASEKRDTEMASSTTVNPMGERYEPPAVTPINTV